MSLTDCCVHWCNCTWFPVSPAPRCSSLSVTPWQKQGGLSAARPVWMAPFQHRLPLHPYRVAVVNNLPVSSCFVSLLLQSIKDLSPEIKPANKKLARSEWIWCWGSQSGGGRGVGGRFQYLLVKIFSDMVQNPLRDSSRGGMSDSRDWWRL